MPTTITTTWTKMASRLSPSYFICDQDESQHVYKIGGRWVRATVLNHIVRSHSTHRTKSAAMAD